MASDFREIAEQLYKKGFCNCTPSEQVIERAIELAVQETWEEAGQHGYPPEKAIATRISNRLLSESTEER